MRRSMSASRRWQADLPSELVENPIKPLFDRGSTPLPGEEALYGQFRGLLDAASKDTEVKKALVEPSKTSATCSGHSLNGSATAGLPAMAGTASTTRGRQASASRRIS